MRHFLWASIFHLTIDEVFIIFRLVKLVAGRTVSNGGGAGGTGNNAHKKCHIL